MNNNALIKPRLTALGWLMGICLSGCGHTESTQNTTQPTRMDSAVTRVIDSVTAKVPDSTATRR